MSKKESFIINPETGRKIKVGGPTYIKLKKEGTLKSKKIERPTPKSIKNDIEKLFPNAKKRALKDATKYGYKLTGTKADIIKTAISFTKAGYTKKDALDESLWRHRLE